MDFAGFISAFFARLVNPTKNTFSNFVWIWIKPIHAKILAQKMFDFHDFLSLGRDISIVIYCRFYKSSQMAIFGILSLILPHSAPAYQLNSVQLSLSWGVGATSGIIFTYPSGRPSTAKL